MIYSKGRFVDITLGLSKIIITSVLKASMFASLRLNVLKGLKLVQNFEKGYFKTAVEDADALSFGRSLLWRGCTLGVL